ncbi:MAG: DUF3566 domain-containing protein [Ilumatobacteraceae bacterium]
MDSGVPQASNRAGSRAGGGGVKPPGNKSGSAKSNGNGSQRPGPVDPRTEDPSSPLGISRVGKTVWRRPGALTPRTAKHRETGSVEMPIDFAVALPLAPVPVDEPETQGPDTVADAVVDTEARALAPTVEVVAPAPSATTQLVPIAPSLITWAPADLMPDLAPTELVPTDLPLTPVLTPAPILYDEAATIDDVTQIGPILETRPLRRPVTFRRAPKPRVRRVTRVVRHVDTWSVFKVALVFNAFFYAVALVAGVLLWQVAYATGTIDNVEKFFEGFGWETFNFNGGQIFHNAWIAGLFVAVGLTGLAVLLATLFNLITDLVGGIRLSVLEEEVRPRVERGTELVVDEPVAAPTDGSNVAGPEESPGDVADQAIAG